MSRQSSLGGLLRRPSAAGTSAAVVALILLLAAAVAAAATGSVRASDVGAVVAWVVLIGVAAWYGLERV